MIDSWLDQVAHELLPKDPAAALSLLEAFIEAMLRGLIAPMTPAA